MLTILDAYTRECHMLRADRALKSSDVLEWIGRAIAEHGSLAYLRSDNGPEFIAKEVQRWLAANQIKTIYIEPAVRGKTASSRVSMNACRRVPQPGAALDADRSPRRHRGLPPGY